MWAKDDQIGRHGSLSVGQMEMLRDEWREPRGWSEVNLDNRHEVIEWGAQPLGQLALLSCSLRIITDIAQPAATTMVDLVEVSTALFTLCAHGFAMRLQTLARAVVGYDYMYAAFLVHSTRHLPKQ